MVGSEADPGGLGGELSAEKALLVPRVDFPEGGRAFGPVEGVAEHHLPDHPVDIVDALLILAVVLGCLAARALAEESTM